MTRPASSAPASTPAIFVRAAYNLGFYHEAILRGVQLVLGEFGMSASKTEVLKGISPLKGALQRILPPPKAASAHRKLEEVYKYVSALKEGHYSDQQAVDAAYNTIEDLCEEVQAISVEYGEGHLNGAAATAFRAGRLLSAWHDATTPPYKLSEERAKVLFESLSATGLTKARAMAQELHNAGPDVTESVRYSRMIRGVHNLILRSLDEQIALELQEGGDASPSPSPFTSTLTGLPGLGQFDVDLALLLQQANDAAPASLSFIDLDNLKALNKRVGHDAADEGIKQLAALLGELTSSRGQLYHRSGDEFLLLLPNHTDEEALLLLTRAISIIKEHNFNFAGEVQSLSASAGIATSAGMASLDEVKKRAVIAMQAAKAHGKGCAAVWLPGMEFESDADPAK